MSADGAKCIAVLAGESTIEEGRFRGPKTAGEVLHQLEKTGPGRLKDEGGVYVTASDVLEPGTYRFYRAQAPPPGAAGGVVGVWRQVDGSLLTGKRKLLYATIIVTNEYVSPERRCEIRAAVDSGCTFELVLPRRKVEQLGLGERERTTATGFGDKVNDMIIYRPAKVQLPATVNDSEVVYKEADLVVAARDVPLLQEEDSSSSEFAGLRKPKQVVLEDGAVKISPMSSPQSPATVPEAILGLPGMVKLRLKLDAEHSCLLPMVNGELVVHAIS